MSIVPRRALFLVCMRIVLPAFLLTGCGARGTAREPRVFILDELEKPTGNQDLHDAPDVFRSGAIALCGAGNEVVAFQAVLRADGLTSGLDARVTDLAGMSGSAGPVMLKAADCADLFLEHYVTTADASYSWGPGGGGALDWRVVAWPDALIPFRDSYSTPSLPVAVPFAIDPRRHRNQAVWVDWLIPRGAPPGEYRGALELLRQGRAFKQIPITLTVFPFDLPSESHVDAFGELYRETGVMYDSGVKFKEHPERDWPIYRRYLQLAHAHRLLAMHRAGDGPVPRTPSGEPATHPDDAWGTVEKTDWSLYTPYVKPVLDGSLFTLGQGYRGPCAGAPPSFFPAPFVETFTGADELRHHLRAHGGQLDPRLLATWRDNAAAFWREVQAQGWTEKRFFAYIFDEVDGEQDAVDATGNALAGNSNKNINDKSNDKYNEMTAFHHAMVQTQAALDAGTGGQRRIHLVWTSHADPARWAGTPADLRGALDWWAPNGHALDLNFFRPLLAAGTTSTPQTVWFYHSGQPAVGNHTINQTGVDLALWGLLPVRYGLNGAFMWSVMSFAQPWNAPGFNPFDHPTYKDGDTRWGNGVLFYPGARLTQAGAARNIAGPIPSLRLKAWRRGLQDAEYVWLARQRGRGAEADALIKTLIPAAFSEAPKRAEPGRWSQQPAAYAAFRLKLAGLIK